VLVAIRTYTAALWESDSESEAEAGLATALYSENEASVTVAQRLVQNLEKFDAEVSIWALERQPLKTDDGKDVLLVRKPTASGLGHQLLHPGVYRYMEPMGNLNHFARRLGVSCDWEQKATLVLAARYFRETFNDFMALPEDTSEAVLQQQFCVIAGFIGALLNFSFMTGVQNKVIVRGFLARTEYDARGSTDSFLKSRSGIPFLATEIKTPKTFPSGQMWFHSTRGVQTLMALYAYQSPTFLFTNKHWKLFMENETRTGILTFPFDEDIAISDFNNIH
jgi:hypothetical protein